MPFRTPSHAFGCARTEQVSASLIARLMQGIIEKKGLSPRPFIPINKPGGSGAEALRYLKDKSGDDHTVMMTLNSSPKYGDSCAL